MSGVVETEPKYMRRLQVSDIDRMREYNDQMTQNSASNIIKLFQHEICAFSAIYRQHLG